MSYINSINNSDTNYLISGVSDIIVCSTSASTVAKTATAMDAFSLDSNLSFKIKFTEGNTASSPTLNLSSTGAKSLTTTTSDYTLVAETVYDCYYNGTSYVLDNTVTVHTANTSNPHSVTKTQVGLGNCDNTADANKAVASAGKLTSGRITYVTLGTASTTTTRDWSGNTTIPVNGVLGVANGGTGQTTLALARNAMGLGNTTGSLPVANGGTGTTSILGILQALRNGQYYSASGTTESGGSWTNATINSAREGYMQRNYGVYVEKSYFSTSGGYIKYSNGLLIQWGKANKTGISGSDRIITISGLLFSTPPIVVFSPLFSAIDSTSFFPDITSITASSFTVNTRLSKNDVPITWIAIGY